MSDDTSSPVVPVPERAKPEPYKPDDLPPGYEDTTRYKRLPNGAVYDRKVGKIVSNPGGGLYAVKGSESLKAAHAERILRAKLAAQDALSSLAISSGKNKSSIRGWQMVVSAQAELAVDTDRGRASTDAARFVGQATGYLALDKRGDDTDSGGNTLQDATIGLLAGALSQFIHAGGLPGRAASTDSGSDSPIIDGEWVE